MTEVISTFSNEIKNRSRNGMGMKGKRMIAGILLVGIILVTLTGCKKTDFNGKKR